MEQASAALLLYVHALLALLACSARLVVELLQRPQVDHRLVSFLATISGLVAELFCLLHLACNDVLTASC